VTDADNDEVSFFVTNGRVRVVRVVHKRAR